METSSRESAVRGDDLEYPLAHVVRLLDFSRRDRADVRGEALDWAVRAAGIEPGLYVEVEDAATGERAGGIVEDWGFTPGGDAAVRVEMEEGDGIRAVALGCVIVPKTP